MHTYQTMRALVMPTLFIHCVEPSAHLYVWFFADSLAIPTSPIIVNVLSFFPLTFCQVT